MVGEPGFGTVTIRAQVRGCEYKVNRSTRLFPAIGAAGFEPATPCSQSRCATRLRHTPIADQSMPRARTTLHAPGGRYQAAPNCSAAIQRASDIVSRRVPIAVTASPRSSSSRQPSLP